MMSLGCCNKKIQSVFVVLQLTLLCIGLSSCARLPVPIETSNQHLSLPGPDAPGFIPPLAEASPLPPPPSLSKGAERYSVIVNNVPAQEILFALARDAKVNVEIHPNITGTVTMNIIDQTITEILDAISRQIDMRYELKGKNLIITPDSPYLKTYQIDYPNVTRKAENKVTLATSVLSIGQSGGGGASGSDSKIETISNNMFWETLITNVKDLLRETDKVMPEGAESAPPPPQVIQPQPVAPQQTTPQHAGAAHGAQAKDGKDGAQADVQPAALPALPAPIQTQTTPARGTTFREAASVIANPESGTISVRATSRQHASVREFLDKVMLSAKRQVLIEATIVEVALTDQYQQGIDWNLVSKIDGLSFIQPALDVGNLSPSVLGTIRYTNHDSIIGDISGAIRMLETFGKLHVLSSPKLSVLNNQTSLLRVVDEVVYFTIDVTAGTPATIFAAGTPTVYETEIHTVPVGFHMYVTPQIGSDEEVTLNLRPTISRIIRYAKDPNPGLADYNLTNLIPEIQTREMESILRVRNNEIAVLGGLMQDSRAGDTNQVPGISGIFGLGELFKARNSANKKSELVIFLRPIILNQERQNDILRQYPSPTDTTEWRRATTQQPKVSP